MTVMDLVERLAEHKTLGAAPREELAWLAGHGSLRHLKTGDVLSSKSERVDNMFVVLSGRVAIFVDRSSGQHKMMEWRGGDVTGTLPYSRMVNPPGDSVAQEPTEVLAIPRGCLKAMARECNEATGILVHNMLDRARAFTSSDLHDEKMVSLGKLSAGLAHELNNPVSAIERAVARLAGQLDDSEAATRALCAARLTDDQLIAVDAIRAICFVARRHGVRSPIEEAEREEAIADWLADHRLDESAAETLAETEVTFEALDQLVEIVQGPALDAVLAWAAAECSVRSLATDIQDAAMRISGLVIAVKGFTHMDQATVAEPVDVEQGLANTIAVLRAKATLKSASVVIEAEPGLPRVLGFVGELNQIWANLIDNALDAVAESGRVVAQAKRDGRRVVVRIVDDGPGMTAEVRKRIFDPFFTTKPMGQGTGLGLDIVRRLVQHNDGSVAVESEPGRTEFRVTLRLAESDGAGGTQ